MIVSHFLTQQPTVIYLFTETKYITLCEAIKQVVWLRLPELGLEKAIFSMTLKTDNKGLIVLIFNRNFILGLNVLEIVA